MTENQLCSFQSSLDKLRWKDNPSLPLPPYAHPNKSEKWKTLRILSNIRIPSESMYNAEKHLLKKMQNYNIDLFLNPTALSILWISWKYIQPKLEDKWLLRFLHWPTTAFLFTLETMRTSGKCTGLPVRRLALPLPRSEAEADFLSGNH